jgi:hypothetical protein
MKNIVRNNPQGLLILAVSDSFINKNINFKSSFCHFGYSGKVLLSTITT